MQAGSHSDWERPSVLGYTVGVELDFTGKIKTTQPFGRIKVVAEKRISLVFYPTLWWTLTQEWSVS